MSTVQDRRAAQSGKKVILLVVGAVAALACIGGLIVKTHQVQKAAEQVRLQDEQATLTREKDEAAAKAAAKAYEPYRVDAARLLDAAEQLDGSTHEQSDMDSYQARIGSVEAQIEAFSNKYSKRPEENYTSYRDGVMAAKFFCSGAKEMIAFCKLRVALSQQGSSSGAITRATLEDLRTTWQFARRRADTARKAIQNRN